MNRPDMKLLVKVLHWIFFREGKYEEARLVLRFLQNGKLNLGLDDASNTVESELAKIDCKIVYGGPPRYLATAYLTRWN